MFTALGVLVFIASVGTLIAMFVSSIVRKTKAEELRRYLAQKNTPQAQVDAQVASVLESPFPAITIPASLVGVGVGLVLFLFTSIFFYAEPGYVYHVRTILGQEKVVSDVGYNSYLFGRINSWKRALTVQTVISDHNEDQVDSENEDESLGASASIPAMNLMFLDQVDADVEATVRFNIPTDPETFLHLAHEYRTPDNLLRTALIPAFKETLQANASLMSAEDYYSGARTEFNTEFENQMNNGIYVVRREEVTIKDESLPATGTANASEGTNQQAFGDNTKVVFRVNKVLDASGVPIRKVQNFSDFGITVVDARITGMQPNEKFLERMQLKQKASADRAIAREQKIQEEEQKLLAIARGEREVAERQAKAKVEQIQQTTEAETKKQLTITAATETREQARIAKESAALLLDKARIDADATKVTAQAEAFKKEAVMKADNALAQKLEAEIQIQRVWADAFAKRQVPSTVIGGATGVTAGNDSEVSTFMKLLTMEAAKRLAYDRSVTPAP